MFDEKVQEIVEALRRSSNWTDRFQYSLLCLWQFQLLENTVDAVQCQMSCLASRNGLEFAIVTKGPPQHILMGSRNDTLCILQGLSAYLESLLEHSPDEKYLFPGRAHGDVEHDAVDTFCGFATRMYEVVKTYVGPCGVKQPWMVPEVFGSIHSMYEGRFRYSDTIVRSGWKTSTVSRTSAPRATRELLASKTQLYQQDVRVGSVLCIGGPVKYTLKDGVCISDDWLFKNVIPRIRKRFDNDVALCRILALPLFYACLDDNISVPEAIRLRVKTAYRSLGYGQKQPVAKVPFNVHRCSELTSDLDLFESPIPLAEYF